MSLTMSGQLVLLHLTHGEELWSYRQLKGKIVFIVGLKTKRGAMDDGKTIFVKAYAYSILGIHIIITIIYFR